MKIYTLLMVAPGVSSVELRQLVLFYHELCVIDEMFETVPLFFSSLSGKCLIVMYLYYLKFSTFTQALQEVSNIRKIK